MENQMVNGANDTATSKITTDHIARFLVTFFLGFVGSIIINHTTLKPVGHTSRTWAYLVWGILTLGIYQMVASICNLFFDPTRESNIGYCRDKVTIQ